MEQSEGLAAEAKEAVEKAGGCVVGLYKEPLGGHQTLLAILPIDKIEPTPFQRDLSDTHHKRLADVINKTGRFLDPVIAVRRGMVGFGPQMPPPSGGHAPPWSEVDHCPDRGGTRGCLADAALNTEKAHNLKERSLEVIRIYRGLVEEDSSRPESGFAFYLDHAALVTLGVCYEKVPRFGGVIPSHLAAVGGLQ